MREHGGSIQKYIGDAVYAVFPEPGAPGAMGAVRAALAIRAFLSGFNESRTQSGLFPIQVGFGITTGKVLWGRVGSEERQDYVFVGPDVSRAAVLEGLSKKGTCTNIILGPTTKTLLETTAATRPLESGQSEAAEFIEFL